MSTGGQQAGNGHGAALRRMQSNWADEVLAEADEAAAEEDSEVRHLRAMHATIESQVESLEAAMDPRVGGALAGAYGRQVYGSIGPMLRQAQTTSSELAQRVQDLSEIEDMPRDVMARSSELVARVERACLAHQARCPPQELERRMSRDPSFSITSSPSAATSSAPGDTATAAADAAAPPPPLGEGNDSLRSEPPAGRQDQRRDHRQMSDGSATTRPLTRTLTLDDVVKETAELETGHRRQRQEQARGVPEHGDGAAGGGGGDGGSATPEGQLGGAGGGGSGEVGDQDIVDVSRNEAFKGQDFRSQIGADGIPGGADGDLAAPAAAAAAARAAAGGGRNGGVRVYSFGRGDLGALLHSDDADHAAAEGPVALKDHWSVLQVSTSLFHTMAVTAFGDILGCGQNDEGQVRPDQPSEAFLPRPSLVEPVLNHRVTQVACGLYHTACLTASGVCLTWGGNESGQLGHSAEATRMVRPMAVQVAGAGQAWSSRRRAVRVACGDLFTLILTSRAEVLSCGVGECVGGDGTDRRQAALVQSLAGFPAVWMACGNSHSVVIGAGGEALAFGLNSHGQLGVGKLGDGEGPAVLLPRPVVGTFSKPVTGGALTTPPPSAADAKNGNNDTSAVTSPPTAKSDPADATAAAMAAATATAATGATTAAAAGGDGGSGSGGGAVGGATPPVFLATRAACGQSHTVLVSAAGEVWATGRNRAGQLGVNPEEVAETPVPVAVPFLLQDDSRAAAREGGEGQTGGGGEGGGGATVAVQAAAGRAHTLVLLSDGRVVGFGSDEFGALGAPPPAPASSEAGDGPGADSGMEVDDPPPMPPSYHWRPAVVEELKDQRITSVSAGGEQSLALAVDPVPAVAAESAAASPPRPQASPPRPPAAEAQHGVAAPTDASVGSALSAGEQKSAAAAAAPALVGGTSTATPSTEGATGGGDGEGDGVEGAGAGSGGAPISRQGSQAMYLRRRFSLPPALRMRTVGEFLQLVRRAAAAGVGKAGEGEAPQGVAEEAAVLEAVRQTFGSPSVLSGCFNVNPPAAARGRGDRRSGHGGAGRPGGAGANGVVAIPRVDAEGLDAVYAGLVGLGPRVAGELWSSVGEGMAAVAASQSSPASSPPSPPSLDAAGVSFLLKYWQGSSFSRDGGSGGGGGGGGADGGMDEATERIGQAVMGLKGHARWWLMRSVKEDYPPALFSSRLVKPMSAHLGVWLKNRGRKRSAYPVAALMLKWLHSLNELEAESKIPYEDFFSDAMSSIPLEALLQDLTRWKALTPAARKKEFLLSEYAFLISTGTKKALLQAEAEHEQLKAARATGARFIPGVGLVFNPFLVLKVQRSHLLQETLAQVSRVPDSGLRKKLKVVFQGEEGVDEGGVAKEFFQLLTVQLFDQSFGMFVPAGKEGRSLWFNKDCVWADEEYGLVGLLVGLAVYSGVILDVPLPLVVFKKVLGEQLSLKDLGDIDPDLLQGFRRLLDYDGGDDEDVFGIDFRVTWDDLGMERSHDLLEGGADIPVTTDNKEEYVELYANFLLSDAVSRQFDHFKQGFLRVMSGASSIALLRAEELEVLVTGTQELDFEELAKATEYDGGFDEDHPTVSAFWRAVAGMPPEEQRRLLMFVTGSKKAPLGGLGKLPFKILRAGPDTDHLPTSHTCFNVLVLPEYSDAEKLTRLLKRAITECEGFGLK